MNQTSLDRIGMAVRNTCVMMAAGCANEAVLLSCMPPGLPISWCSVGSTSTIYTARALSTAAFLRNLVLDRMLSMQVVQCSSAVTVTYTYTALSKHNCVHDFVICINVYIYILCHTHIFQISYIPLMKVRDCGTCWQMLGSIGTTVTTQSVTCSPTTTSLIGVRTSRRVVDDASYDRVHAGT